MTINKTLKAILVAALALGWNLGGASRVAEADPSKEAAAFIKALFEQVLAIQKHENVGTAESLRDLIRDGFDLDLTSQLVLGKSWDRATPRQRREFKDFFAEYLVNTYASHLKRYRIGTLTVVASKRVAGGDFLVQTSIDRGSDTADAVWRVRAWDSEYRIIDILIDGISLALTHRSEFASVIQRGGFEKLLQILRKRTSTHADFGNQLSRFERTPYIALPARILVSPGASKLNILLRQ